MFHNVKVANVVNIFSPTNSKQVRLISFLKTREGRNFLITVSTASYKKMYAVNILSPTNSANSKIHHLIYFFFFYIGLNFFQTNQKNGDF